MTIRRRSLRAVLDGDRLGGVDLTLWVRLAVAALLATGAATAVATAAL